GSQLGAVVDLAEEARAGEVLIRRKSHQVDEGRNHVERAAYAEIAHAGAVGSDVSHAEGTGVPTGPPVGDGPDPAERRMLETPRGTFPHHDQIGFGPGHRALTL